MPGARGSDREGRFSGAVPYRAIIDIGSNTIRLVVYGGSPRAPTVLLNEKVAARLGRDIATRGVLAHEAVELAMRGLARYALLLRDLEIEDVEVVATSATREASNGTQFLDSVRSLGFEPRLLSGEEEATVSAWGVIGAFPGAAGMVADLGGGSLELIPIANGTPGTGVSLPIGTLRMAELARGDRGRLKKVLRRRIEEACACGPVKGDLYLVGGTLRAMAVYAMEERGHPLSDPHGLRMSAKNALGLARVLARSEPADLRQTPRISTMRSATLPDAGVLLQALIKLFEPEQIVASSWGLREGLVYSSLGPHARAQDPLIAGVSTFAGMRGATPIMAASIASWTVDALPATGRRSERLRLAATMLSLATMQVEPNLRLQTGVGWALQKRWIAIGPEGRAMLAAAICANGNHLELPDTVVQLADKESLDQAIGWGLAIRLARRLGGRSRQSLRKSRLFVDGGALVLALEKSHSALFGIPNEKDLDLLSDWMALRPECRLVDSVADVESANAVLPAQKAR